jgi:cytochrome c oxidase subunit 1
MAYIGGIHYWWPKISGRMYPERLAQFSAILIFAGFNLTFFPQFILGLQGMPRRYAVYPPEYQLLNILSSIGSLVLIVGYVLPLFYLIPSLFRGRRTTNNPWGATGLEWQTSSPPPPQNFYQTPVVTHEAYDFGAIKDVIAAEAE